MENIIIPTISISSSPNSIETIISISPKKIFQSILCSPCTQISNTAPNQMQKKRTFNLDFQDFEEASPKALKLSQTKRIPQKNVFKAGTDNQNSLSKIELQKYISEAISAAIQPLTIEIQALKSEIISLKNAKNTKIS